jgi:hypothetical protein
MISIKDFGVIHVLVFARIFVSFEMPLGRKRIDNAGPAPLPDYTRAQALQMLNQELLNRLRESTLLIERLRREMKEMAERVSEPTNVTEEGA